MSETSIGDYAFISDCQSAALVTRDGSVEWYCPARFDSPSVFARLLDEDGGHWSIRPVGEFEVERAYLDDTMVLRTGFHTAQGRVTLTDALALESGARGHDIGVRGPHVLLRRAEGIEGEIELEVEFSPRLEYGLTTPLVLLTDTGIEASGGPVELHLVTGCPLKVNGFKATARLTLRAGEVLDFALVYRRAFGGGAVPDLEVGAELENTGEGWRSWSEMHRGYEGPYVDQVRRSALVLQALTYQPTGAVTAAATTSLPETCGAGDNWDYRFAWLRDLSLTLRALWVAACPDEAKRFFYWVDRAVGAHLTDDQQQVQIMYGVEGERDLTEHSLEHLRGFRDSRPVRVGNDAWFQKQLDVLGEIVDAAHLLRDQLGDEFDDVIARLVSSFADKAAQSWEEEDTGMWEARDAVRPYLSSKVMCWVALNRAIELAPRLGEHANVKSWKVAREEIREAILERGWSEEVGAYTGAFGSDQLDASVLLMPLVDFLPADDPRMWSTIEAVERELARDGLVHRWAEDGNGFLICTYWLVECLARAGETERAVEVFERTTSYANDLGLLAEEADAATGELWGNFPQAFSHVGLINA
ncbi:MAG: glycoside hydrolase family 15 protein, partial [Actinobacteria bacterium]|nr:glycoside hydrolase family 15 protein [Actinomycetota bacterium]